MFRSRNRLGAARPAGRASCVAERLEGRTLLAAVSGTVYYDANANGAYEAGGGDAALEGVVVYHDANNNGQYDSGAATVFAPAIGLPRAIRDFSTTTSTIVVETLPGVVRDVDVMVNIEHSFTYDLMVTLQSPGGDEIVLFDNVGGDFFSSMDFAGTILDDEAGFSINEGEPPFSGRYQPQEALSTFDGDPMNGAWVLRITDFEAGDEGALIDWSLTFDTGAGEPATGTDFEGNYTLGGLGAGTYRIRQVIFDGYRQTQPATTAAYVLTLTANQTVTGRNFGQTFGAPVAAVAGRHLFYNRSAFDGFDAAANAGDDGAIATDKRALRSGSAATFENYSSYSRGINGVMVDISDLPSGAAPTASDFQFRVGNDGEPGNWTYLDIMPAVSLRRGAGVNGSDRITLTWPDGTIVGQWLEVTVNATGNTGLPSSDVFLFGNLPGEVGDAANARITATDVLAVRRAGAGGNRAIDDPLDFNRDRRVNSLDYAIARANIGRSLFLVTAGAAGAVAAQGELFGSVPVTPRRGTYQPPRAWSETERNLLA